MEAYSANKTCIATGADRRVFLLHSYNVDDGGPHFLFIAPTEYKTESGLAYMRIKIYQNGNVSLYAITARTPNVKHLIFTDENGETMYAYDGSEEVKVPNNGSGTGGNADWAVNDPDASGYVKNRTHWVEEGMAYVMPVRDYVPDTGGAAQITSPLPDSIVAGAELIVNYNGTDYPAVVSAINLEGYDTLAFGCYGALTGGEMTADPYAFVVMPEEGVANSGVYAVILSLDGSTAFTFGIKASGEVVHKLDEKYIPDSVKAPTITITKQNDNYTVDYPFEDAWAMAENVLQSAFVYVDKDSKWLERLSAASVSKLGTSSESGFDVIQIMLEPYYDATADAIQKLCLVWTRFRENGFIRSTGIRVHQNLVLMDARSIPGFIAGPGLTANADKIEIKAGDGLHIPTEGIGFNNLTLNTMSETTKGGAMVGDGLEVVDRKLRIKAANAENAGKLLFVNENGTLSPLSLGTGLKIVDGVLTIEASMAIAVAGMALSGQVKVGEV
jgi:hypothetical protein